MSSDILFRARHNEKENESKPAKSLKIITRFILYKEKFNVTETSYFTNKFYRMYFKVKKRSCISFKYSFKSFYVIPESLSKQIRGPINKFEN